MEYFPTVTACNSTQLIQYNTTQYNIITTDVQNEQPQDHSKEKHNNNNSNSKSNKNNNNNDNNKTDIKTLGRIETFSLIVLCHITKIWRRKTLKTLKNEDVLTEAQRTCSAKVTKMGETGNMSRSCRKCWEAIHRNHTVQIYKWLPFWEE